MPAALNITAASASSGIMMRSSLSDRRAMKPKSAQPQPQPPAKAAKALRLGTVANCCHLTATMDRACRVDVRMSVGTSWWCGWAWGDSTNQDDAGEEHFGGAHEEGEDLAQHGAGGVECVSERVDKTERSEGQSERGEAEMGGPSKSHGGGEGKHAARLQTGWVVQLPPQMLPD